MADVNVNLSFTADTSKAKAQLRDLQNTLQNIMNKSNTGSDQSQITKKISEASRAAAELKVHLEQATNVKTGNLDFVKLNNSLKESGMSLAQYGNKLQQLGPEGQAAFAKLTSAVAQAEIPIKRANTKLQQFATTLKNTAKWQISSSLLHGFIGAVQSAYGYAQDLNESLNNIRIVTGYNVDKMSQFALEANKAAKALSTTTTAYTDASLIYYQQGLNDQEVKERTDVTIKLANVARESATDVSDQMTAVWNNFADGSKSLEYYADVITKLGAATAASNSEIAEGIEKFAAISHTVGLSYEYATSALTTVVDRTRQSADTVGTAFKTMFARIQGLKLGETLEDGTTLNQYSQALQAVGINIKEANGNLKDMDVILDEMGAKWKDLNRDEQVALAQKVAGVRQYQQLISLMENYDFFKENVDLARGSSGALQEQADIYAESWEAARKRVKASAENIYNDLLNDKGFISFLNTGSKILDIIDSFIHQLGGLKGVLSTLSVLVTTLFEKQIAASFHNAAESLKMMTEAGRQAAQQEQQNQLTDMMKVLYKNNGTGLSNEQKAEKEGLQDLIQLHQELINKKGEMTAQEEQFAKVSLDMVKSASEKYQQEAKQLDEIKEKRSQVYEILNEDIAGNIANGTLAEEGQDFVQVFTNAKTELDSFVESQKNLDILSSKFEQFSQKGVITENRLKQLKNTLDTFETNGLQVGELGNLFNKLDPSKPEEYAATLKAISAEFQHLKTVSINNLAESLGFDEKQTERLRNFVTLIERDREATESTDQAHRNLKNTNKTVGDSFNQLGQQVQNTSTSLVQGMQAISSMFSAFYMLQGLWDTIKDPDTSGIEKFFKVFSSAMMILPMVITSMTRLKAAIKGLTSEKSLETIGNTLNTLATILNTKAKKENADAENKVAQDTAKATGAKEKNTLANLKESAGYAKLKEGATKLAGSLKSVAISLGPVLIGIAALSAAIAAGSAIWNAENNEAEKAKQVANDLSESLSDITDAYNEFANTVKSYEDLTDSMKDLTAGTNEYKEALFKANNEAMQLIDSYKDLNYYINDQGLVVITPESLKNLKEAKQESLQLAQTTTLLAQEEAKRAELRVKEQTLNRDKIKADGFSVDAVTSIGSGTLAGAGAGLALGALLGGPVGAAIGAMIGSSAGIAGGVGFGLNNQETSSEQKAISALSDAYKTLGNSIFSDENSLKEALKGADINLEDDKLISSLLENKASIIELITATNDNSSKIFSLNQTLMKKTIDETPSLSGKSETQKKLMASGTANQLAKKTSDSMEFTNFLTSNKNGFWGGVTNFVGKLWNNYVKSQSPGYEGAKDYQMYSIKELRQAFAESRGYDASLAIDEGKDKTKFLDAQGNELETISNETMRILINQQKNAEEMAKSLEENGPLWDSLSSKLEKFSEQSDLNIDPLIDLLSGDTTSALNYTKNQIEDIIKSLRKDAGFTPEEIGLLNLKDGLEGVLNSLGQQSDKLWNSIGERGQKAFGGYGLKTASQLESIALKTGVLRSDIADYYGSLSDKEKTLFLTIDFDSYKTQENWEKQLSLLKNKENIVDIKLNISNLESIKEALSKGDYDTIKNAVGDYHFADFMALSPEQQQASINSGLEQSYADLYNSASTAEKDARQGQLDALDAYQYKPSFKQAHQEGESFNEVISDHQAAATEQYKSATDDLNQSLIDQQTALQGLADIYGMDKNELSSLIEAFGSMSNVLKDNEGLAAQVANRYMRLQNAVLDLSKNYKDYEEILITLKNTSNAADKAALKNSESYKKLQSSVADLLGTTEDFIDADLLSAIDPADLKKAAAGDEAAIERIRSKFVELQAQIAGLNETSLAGLKQELASLKEGDVFTLDATPFLTELIQAKVNAGANAAEIKALLSGFDIDADVSDFEVAMSEATNAASDAAGAIVADTSFEQEVQTADVEQKTKAEDVAFEESFIPHPVEMTNTVLENEASDAKTVNTKIWVGNKTVTPHVISEDGSEVTPAKSVKTKTGSGKEGKVHGVKIENAHKSVGSSVSPGTRSTAGKNLGGGKGGGGGGGGKSNPAEKKELTKKSDVVDRYKQINDKLNTVNKNMDKYNKLSEMAYGKNKLKSMEKILNAYKQQIRLQQQLKKEAEGYLPEDKKNMEAAAADLGTRKLQYDNDGNIKNIEAVQSDIFAKINAAETKYNSFATKEQQDEYNKATLEPLMKQYEEFKDYLSKYEDTKQQIADADAAEMDAQMELLSLKLEKVKTKIEQRVEVRLDEINRFKKSLEKLDNVVYATAERFALLNAEFRATRDAVRQLNKGITNTVKNSVIRLDKNGKPIKNKNGEFYTYGDYLNERSVKWATDQVNKEDPKGKLSKKKRNAKIEQYAADYRNTKMEKLMNGEVDSDFWNNWMITEDGMEALKSFKDQAADLEEVLQEIKDTVDNELPNAFNKWTESMDRASSKMDRLISQYSTWMDIIELLGQKRLGLSDDEMRGIDQGNVNMALTNLGMIYDKAKTAEGMRLVTERTGAQQIAAMQTQGYTKNRDSSEMGKYANTLKQMQDELTKARQTDKKNGNKKAETALKNTDEWKQGRAEIDDYRNRHYGADPSVESLQSALPGLRKKIQEYEDEITHLREIREAAEAKGDQEKADKATRMIQRRKLEKQALEDELSLIKKEISQYKEADKLDQQYIQKEIEKIQKNIDDMQDYSEQSQQEMLEAFLNVLQLARQAAENNFEYVAKDFEKRISGGYASIEDMQTAMDRNKKISERYLADYEKVYELTKLNRDLEKKMDETTNLKAKQKLAEYQEKILNYAKEGVKMSKYDLEYMQKEYDLEVARIALEEAQNAKSQVRLTRDAEGNYSYTYTADASKTAEAEQSYEDKMNDLIKLSNEYQEEMLANELALYKESEDAFRELYLSYVKGDIATKEEYEKKKDELEAFYTSQSLYYAEERDKAAKNNTSVLMNEFAPYYDITQKKIGLTNSFNEAEINAFNDAKKRMDEARIQRDIEIAQIEKLYKEGAISQEEYQKRLNGVNEEYYNTLWLAEGTIRGIMTNMGDGMDGIITDAHEKFVPDYSNIWVSATASAKHFATEFNGENNPNSLVNQVDSGADQLEQNVRDAMDKMGIKIGENENTWDVLKKVVQSSVGDQKGNIGSLQAGADELAQHTKADNEAAGESYEKSASDVETWYNTVYPKLVDVQNQIDNITNSVDSLQTSALGLTDIKPTATTKKTQGKIDKLNLALDDLQKRGVSLEDIKPTATTKKTQEKIDNLTSSLNNLTKAAKAAKAAVGEVGDTTPTTPTTPAQKNGQKRTITDKEAKIIAAAIQQDGGAKYGNGDVRVKNLTSKIGAENVSKVQGILNEWYAIGGSNYASKQAVKIDADTRRKYWMDNISTTLGFNTGGYTGKWGPDGRWALLHQKELILNAKDTENMLAAVKTVREIAAMVDLQAQQANLAGQYALALGQLPSSRSASIDQNVHITAEFPNVQDHNEVELALTSLVNRASQFAWRN